MTPQQFAAMLNGREYGEEITKDEAALAKQHGLVVMYGHSDDAVVLHGAIDAIFNAYNGTRFHLDKDGFIPVGSVVPVPFERRIAWGVRRDKGTLVHARWNCNNIAWSFGFVRGGVMVELGKEFEVYENGERFSFGVVFHINELGG